jgi:ligand-binding sensor domain-containing protein
MEPLAGRNMCESLTRYSFPFSSDSVSLPLSEPLLPPKLKPPFHTYNRADGLPSNVVTTLHQDSQGMLWIGTDEGICSFDGHRFTKYGRIDGFPLGRVTAVSESPHEPGAIWIALHPGGVAKLTTKGVSTPVSLEDDPTQNLVDGILEDREGRVWAVTHNGIYRIGQTTHNYAQTRARCLRRHRSNLIVLFDRSRQTLHTFQDGTKLDSLLLPSEAGTTSSQSTVELWVGEKGLFRIEGKADISRKLRRARCRHRKCGECLSAME